MHIWKILWKIVDIPISEFVWRTNFAIVGFINCVRYKPRSDLSLKQKKFRYMSTYTHVCFVGCTLWNNRTNDDVVLVHLAKREFIGLCIFFFASSMEKIYFERLERNGFECNMRMFILSETTAIIFNFIIIYCSIIYIFLFAFLARTLVSALVRANSRTQNFNIL